MTKEEAIRKTRTLFWVQALIAATLVMLFETEFIKISINEESRYTVDVAGIMLTLLLIPLAIKGFTTQMHKAVESNSPDIIKHYCTKSSVRSSLLFIVIIINILLYYSGNDSALYCTLLGITAAIYGYPCKRNIDNYLQQEQ